LQENFFDLFKAEQNEEFVTYQNFGRGFIMHNHDYTEIQHLVVTGYQYPANKVDKFKSIATSIGQMFRAALFPGNTAAFGIYGLREGGKPFHLERYEAMHGKFCIDQEYYEIAELKFHVFLICHFQNT
jgi:hypothetical protein